MGACAAGACTTGECDGQGGCQLRTAGTRCGVCAVCSAAGACDDVGAGADPHGDCAPNACAATGACDGSGGCEVVAAGTDPNGVCTATNCSSGECNGSGGCQHDGNGTGCGTCRECDGNGGCNSVGAAVTCYADNDGDGHGNPADSGRTDCGGCGGGRVTNTDDCNDDRPDMYPGNGDWYGDNTDHNCSSGLEKLYTDSTASTCSGDCGTGGCNLTGSINWGSVGCGTSYTFDTSCSCSPDCNSGASETRTQLCH